MEYFLDTNVFLRFLVPDFNHAVWQKECHQLFDQIKAGNLSAVTASYIFAEIVWVLQSFYSLPKPKIIEALWVFRSIGIRIDDQTDLVYALGLFEKHKVKFIDCLIASQRNFRNKNMAIVSYDRDFDVLGIKRLEPAELV